MATATEVPTTVGIRDLLEAGLHFGHQTKRWNPKMKRYIFDKRNGIHIIDLAKSLVKLQEAMAFIRSIVSSGRSVLLVGTKKQAQQAVQEAATATGQHYVTHRWLGGMLTNSTTIRRSVKRMREIEDLEKAGTLETMHKKEAARLKHELEKLRRNLSGVAGMDRLPGALFVVDINREAIAVAEANTLGIPVVAMVDTCCDPDPVTYVIPGNDDAIRAIKLVVSCLANTIKDGTEEYTRAAVERARAEAERAAESARKAAEEKAAKAAEKKAEKAEEAPADENPSDEARPKRRAKAPAREAKMVEAVTEAPDLKE